MSQSRFETWHLELQDLLGKDDNWR